MSLCKYDRTLSKKLKLLHFATLLALGTGMSLTSPLVEASEWSDFLTSFASDRELIDDGIAVAKTLIARDVQLGEPISPETCKAILKKVNENYKPLDAFFQRVNGSLYMFFICANQIGEPTGGFFRKGVFPTHFGKTATYALQSLIPAGYNPNLITLLLDEDHRILELTLIPFMPRDTNEGIVSVQTIDDTGNIYVREYCRRSQALCPYQLAGYFSSQGNMAEFAADWERPRRNKSDEKIRIRNYSRLDKLDWNQFSLLVTHGRLTGFFKYGEKLESRPLNYSSLVLVSDLQGKEICGWGYQNWFDSKKQSKRISSHPENPEACFNEN